MSVLLLGLVLFLGAHSVRVVAPGWRAATMARIGEGRWKGAYSLVSVLGLALIVWGYGLARQAPVELWAPPVWGRHLGATLMLVASIAFFANGKRGDRIALALRHPMLIGTALFATAHLMANGTAADLALFGGLLVWSLATLVSAFGRREPAPPAGSWARTGLDIAIGVAFWAAMLFGLHAWLFGVQPLPLG
jgi:uncharacterized membrane protein